MTGSLQENKGYWTVFFRLRDKNGELKQKTKSTGYPSRDKKGKTINKQKAQARMYEILSEYEDLTFEADKLTFTEYMQDWLSRDKDKVQGTTYDRYISMFNAHIKPYFENMKLKDLKPMHLERYYVEKVLGGLSPNTVNKHATMIRTVLQDALKNGYISKNPADLADRPKREKPKHDYYTAEELTELWKTVQGTDIELPVYLAMFYGLRRSEAVGVKWSVIDLDKCTLTVCTKVTQQKQNGKIISVESNVLKTETSNRVFSITDEHVNYLKSVKQKQATMLRSTQRYIDFVCVNEIGELISPDHISHKFKKILTENGLRKIRFHDLRHSCLTLLANDNRFTMKQVQAYAGHADYTITANTYSHAYAEQKSQELNAITTAIGFAG